MHAATREKQTKAWRCSRGVAGFLLLAIPVGMCAAQQAGPVHSDANPVYLGFDRNDYPGDGTLAALRKSFRYTSYWLNPPPGEKANGWMGKRTILRQYGFGFLVLFNGRSDNELKLAASKGESPENAGAADGAVAVAAAWREGFARNVLIFLDQEEGGRLLPEQAAYVFAWIDAVRAAGARAGVYCSGIEVNEGSDFVSTAEDIAARETARTAASSQAKPERGRRLALWIANDQCPPAPGCTLDAPPLSAALKPSIADFATVWQYAQSPVRTQFSADCRAKPAADGKCYAPGLPPGEAVFVDLDTSGSPDPSEMPD